MLLFLVDGLPTKQRKDRDKQFFRSLGWELGVIGHKEGNKLKGIPAKGRKEILMLKGLLCEVKEGDNRKGKGIRGQSGMSINNGSRINI